MTYTKIKFYIILINKKIPRMNNKKNKNSRSRSLFFNFLGSEYSGYNWYESNTSNSRHLFNAYMYKINFCGKKYIKFFSQQIDLFYR